VEARVVLRESYSKLLTERMQLYINIKDSETDVDKTREVDGLVKMPRSSGTSRRNSRLVMTSSVLSLQNRQSNFHGALLDWNML